MGVMEDDECFFCGCPASDRCGRCDWGRYCYEHSYLHSSETGECLPYLVSQVEGVGKCMVAAR